MIKKVLVTGGAGYLGSVLVPMLLERGYEVRVLDTLWFGDSALGSVKQHLKLEIQTGDVCIVQDVFKALEGVDAVIHLAGVVGDPACGQNQVDAININYIGTSVLIECAWQEGIKRFINASSCSVYGMSDELLDENSSLAPVSLYAQTKVWAEQAIEEFGDNTFKAFSFRMGTLYGVSPRMRFDLALNKMAAQAHVEKLFTVYGGNQWRPLLHVRDAARAYADALLIPNEEIKYDVYNLGSEAQTIQMRQAASYVLQAVPQSQVDINLNNVDKRNYRVDFTRIVNEFAPGIKEDMVEGLAEIAKNIKNGNIQNYKDTKYSNELVMQELNGKAG